MKLVFICPSMGNHGDGVGDYTLRLAGACVDLGHRVECFALDDGLDGLSKQFTEEKISPGGRKFLIHRLPAALPWRDRMDKVQRTFDDIQPDWISVQYVPYGFHKKGMPWGLAGRLASLRGTFRWHLMFHELWIGEEEGYTFYQKLTGQIQRQIARRLALRLGGLIHTSQTVFQDRLQRLGVSSTILPLFSNIPVASPDHLLRKGIVGESSEDNSWVFVFFGALHPEWKSEPLLGRIDRAARMAGRSACHFLSVGRLGGHGEQFWKVLSANPSPGFHFHYFGVQSTEKISQLLQCADFGVAASPFSLLGKSGSAAAMREHGLPVIVSRMEGYDPEQSALTEDLILLDEAFERRLTDARPHPPLPPHSRLVGVAESFVSDLQGVCK